MREYVKAGKLSLQFRTAERGTAVRWDDVRYFLAVARTGGLSAAARAMSVNHSTVFRRVEALEEELGVRLFERLSSGYSLTPAGEQMMTDAERAEQAVFDLERGVAGLDQRLRGEVRLTAPHGIAMDPLPSYLVSLRAAYPDIRVHLVSDNRFLSLKRREADIALRPGPRADEELVGRKVSVMAWAPYASKAYLARAGRPSTLQALRDHALIVPDESLAGLPAARWLARQVPHPDVAVRANDVTTMNSLCAAGMGVAVLPCMGTDEHPEMVRLFPPDPSIHTALYLYTHPDLQHAARIRAVIDHLVQCFADDQRNFLGTDPDAS